MPVYRSLSKVDLRLGYIVFGLSVTIKKHATQMNKQMYDNTTISMICLVCFRSLVKCTKNLFSYFSTKTYLVGTQKIC